MSTLIKEDRLNYRISSRLLEADFLKLSEMATLKNMSPSELVREIVQTALRPAEEKPIQQDRRPFRWRRFRW